MPHELTVWASGAATIGLATTVYLAAQGCTVYVASRNREKSEHGIAEAEKKLNGRGGSIKFHHLDLSTIEGSRRSAEEFKKLEGRLDIIVGNAAIGVEPMDELSEDGWDRAFATNHLGHFAFVTSLLGGWEVARGLLFRADVSADLVEKTASQQGEARIVMVSSEVYKTATKLDYDALRTRIEGDGNSVWQLKAAFIRYCNTKLANVYFTAELDRRLQSRGIKNVYCNSCHPGI